MTPAEESILPPHDSADPGRLRVLMVTPFFGDGGGVGTVARELRDALLDHCVVDVLHWWPRFNDPRFIDADDNVTALRSLDDLLNSPQEYDVLSLQSAAYSDRYGGGLSRIIERFPVPLVYTIHSLAAYHGEVMGDMAGMQTNISDQVECMERAERVLLLTEGVRDIAARYHPEHADKFVVMPNGTNDPGAAEALSTAQATLKAKYQLDDRHKTLLYMGRISREKGIYELVEAFPEIKRVHPDVHLLIAGDKPGDPNVAEIRTFWTGRGLVEGVDYDFVGWVEGDVKDAFYRLADFVIMPSYYEHMPVTALEAMIRETPVILTDMDSLRATFHMDEADRAWVVTTRKAKSAPEIFAAVDYAFTHPVEVARRAQRAYDGVCASYTWTRVAERCAALYHSLHEAHTSRGWQEQFDDSFQRRFDRLFKLCFEGEFARNIGDIDAAITCWQQALELDPNHAKVKRLLIGAYQEQIEALRIALAAEPYNLDWIARLQQFSERLRALLVPTTDRTPEIAAVMPVFIKSDDRHGVRYLIESLNSVVNQHIDAPVDIIVVNDCSQIDVSQLLMRNFKEFLTDIRDEGGGSVYERRASDPVNMRLINKRENSGNDVEPRNIGLIDALRRGNRYITHIDADDRMPPRRLTTSLRYLDASPTTDMVHGRHRCIDEDGVVTSGSQVDGWHNFNRKFTFGMDQNDPANEGRSKRHARQELEILTKDNWVHGGTVTYRSNVLLRIGLDNLTPDRRYGGDHVFWQKLSRVATMDYLSRLLSEYRLHSGSMTQGGR